MNIIKSPYVVPGANSCSPVFSVYLPLALAPSPSPSPSPSPENHGTRDANVLSLAGTARGGNTSAVDIVDAPEFASFAGHIRSILASFSRPRGLRSAFHASNNGQNGSRGLKTVEKSATKNHTWKNASLIIHKQRVANVRGNLRAIPAI